MGFRLTTSLSMQDWDGEIRGWRCPLLRIRGSKIEAVFVDGEKIDDTRYREDSKAETLSWTHDSDPPASIRLQMELPENLSTGEVSVRWKQAAIVLPFIGAILTALIAAPWTEEPPPSKDPEYSVWTISGAVEPAPDDYAFTEVRWTARPPSGRLIEDYSFEEKIPIRRMENGKLQLPNLFFDIPGRPEFDVQVVHLVNDGERLPLNAVDDFGQNVNEREGMITFRRPIPMKRKPESAPYTPPSEEPERIDPPEESRDAELWEPFHPN